jgi:hypothetical protein
MEACLTKARNPNVRMLRPSLDPADLVDFLAVQHEMRDKATHISLNTCEIILEITTPFNSYYLPLVWMYLELHLYLKGV